MSRKAKAKFDPSDYTWSSIYAFVAETIYDRGPAEGPLSVESIASALAPKLKRGDVMRLAHKLGIPETDAPTEFVRQVLKQMLRRKQVEKTEDGDYLMVGDTYWVHDSSRPTRIPPREMRDLMNTHVRATQWASMSGNPIDWWETNLPGRDVNYDDVLELAESMKVFGFNEAAPILVDAETGHIINGHRRDYAARLAGVKPVYQLKKYAPGAEGVIERVKDAITLNMEGKPLSAATKRMIATYLRVEQGFSYRAIADALGAHHTTIMEWLKESEQELATKRAKPRSVLDDPDWWEQARPWIEQAADGEIDVRQAAHELKLRGVAGSMGTVSNALKRLRAGTAPFTVVDSHQREQNEQNEERDITIDAIPADQSDRPEERLSSQETCSSCGRAVGENPLALMVTLARPDKWGKVNISTGQIHYVGPAVCHICEEELRRGRGLGEAAKELLAKSESTGLSAEQYLIR